MDLKFGILNQEDYFTTELNQCRNHFFCLLPSYTHRLLLLQIITLKERRQIAQTDFVFRTLKGNINSKFILDHIKIRTPIHLRKKITPGLFYKHLSKDTGGVLPPRPLPIPKLFYRTLSYGVIRFAPRSPPIPK